MSAELAHVKAFIADNLSALPDAQSVARALGHPYETLRKQFRRAEGVTLHQYLQAERVTRMRHLLASTDLTCYEVGLAVGLEREDTSSKLFKKATGLTMTQYRALHRAAAANQNRQPKWPRDFS